MTNPDFGIAQTFTFTTGSVFRVDLSLLVKPFKSHQTDNLGGTDHVYIQTVVFTTTTKEEQ